MIVENDCKSKTVKFEKCTFMLDLQKRKETFPERRCFFGSNLKLTNKTNLAFYFQNSEYCFEVAFFTRNG